MSFWLILFLTWMIVPHILLWTRPIETKHKVKASICFIDSSLRGLVLLIPDMLAPVVVPIALLFTKWEDEKLPSLFRIWDNDLSLNGDPRRYNGGIFDPVPLEKDNQEVKDGCYWSEGNHPRSFWARYVWMGWRNRVSKGTVMLGKKIPDAPAQYLFDSQPSERKEGWYIIEQGGLYRMMLIRKWGPFAYRFHYGYKVLMKRDGKYMAVNITFSLKRWKG